MAKLTLKEIESNIKVIVLEEMEISEDQAGKITSETNFASDLEVGSLDFINLVMRVEKEFGIDIDDEDYGQIATIGSMAQYVEARIK